VAVVGSALAFGLAHVHPVHVLIAGVLGLVMGFATLRTGSILAGVVLHLANNAASVLISRAGGAPEWLNGWPATVVLCVTGLAGLWLLHGAPEPRAPGDAVPPPGMALPGRA
jgi:membrane protease YdiL (CAAX protease family)